MSRRAAPKANAVLISAAATPPQAWRNGGGQTRELLTWPAQGPWRLRISRADIDADGPFSAFPGVTRWFAVLQGRGVALMLDGRQHAVVPDGDALCFDGAHAPRCTLLDGPTQDLNLMARGAESMMARVQPGVAWHGRWAMRGLYTPIAGHWRSAKTQCVVDANSLLWLEAADAGAWTFTPTPVADGATDAGAGAGGGSAWWLGFTPKE